MALPVRTAADASPAPSREPTHGSRRNVKWLLLRSRGLSPPTFQFAWQARMPVRPGTTRTKGPAAARRTRTRTGTPDRDVRGADRGADRRPDARGRPGRRARRRRDGREPGLRPRRAQGPGRLRQADRERQGDGRGLARDDGRRPHGDPDDRGHDRAHHRGGDRPGLLGIPVRAALQLVAGAGAGNPDQRRQVPAGALAQGRQQGGAIPAHGRHVRPQEPDVHRGQAPWAPRPEGCAGGDHGNRASLRA